MADYRAHWLVISDYGDYERVKVITDEAALDKHRGISNVRIEGPYAPAADQGAVAAGNALAEAAERIISHVAAGRVVMNSDVQPLIEALDAYGWR